jgi:hypothetical protein
MVPVSRSTNQHSQQCRSTTPPSTMKRPGGRSFSVLSRIINPGSPLTRLTDNGIFRTILVQPRIGLCPCMADIQLPKPVASLTSNCHK